MASTLFYDEDDGVVAQLPDRLKGATPEPINPSSRNRKEAILRARANLKAAPAESPGPTTTAVKAKAGSGAKCLDVSLFNPKLSISKPEVANCRVELCCVDESGKRIYVFGAVSSTYGVGLQEDAKALRDHISKHPGITKSEALKYRDNLRAARKS